ncbi:hypothetical protein QE152_g38966 [Popillia japonica]|uniref:Uncharacterized protein n=1 Tax=Popillia japonica TaxID=7064 RepID=A0AAW1HV62_POPJA
MDLKFRKLQPHEIECRIATVKRDGSGLSLLLYTTARAAMAILDEAVGCDYWKRVHPNEKREFCTVAIYNKDIGEWVEKMDVGTESFAEKEKGQASDSFKRSCVNWGIGRELHNAPDIWVNKPDCNTYERNGKYTSNDRFVVSAIDYDKDQIISLEIKNARTKKVVFRLGDIQQPEPIEKDIAFPDSGSLPMSEPKKKEIRSLCKAHGIPVDELFKLNDLTEESATERQAAQILVSFKRKFGDD